VYGEHRPLDRREAIRHRPVRDCRDLLLVDPRGPARLAVLREHERLLTMKPTRVCPARAAADRAAASGSGRARIPEPSGRTRRARARRPATSRRGSRRGAGLGDGISVSEQAGRTTATPTAPLRLGDLTQTRHGDSSARETTSLPRRGAFRNLVAVRVQDEELIDRLAGDVTGCVVAEERVEQVAVVGDQTRVVRLDVARGAAHNQRRTDRNRAGPRDIRPRSASAPFTLLMSASRRRRDRTCTPSVRRS
jgi:hypothetical protein